MQARRLKSRSYYVICCLSRASTTLGFGWVSTGQEQSITSNTPHPSASWKQKRISITSFIRACTSAASKRIFPSCGPRRQLRPIVIFDTRKSLERLRLSYKRAVIRLLDRPGGRFLLGKIATRAMGRNQVPDVEIAYIDG